MKQALNPFLPQDVYIADGEPHVFGDRVYLFGSHDHEGGESFCLLDYEVWSAPVDDLGSWSCPGASYSVKQDPNYSEERCYGYAPDVVRGNDGRYYLYYCLAGWKGKHGYGGPISVAVSDTPDGKYEYLGVVRNPDGTPYLDWVCFDPAVINDDGVIRLYFGSGPFRGMAVRWWNAFVLAKVYAGVFEKPASAFTQRPGPLGANTAVLCDDMLTLKERPKRLVVQGGKGHGFFEGSSIRKWNDTYYFVYSSEKNHELCYAVSRFPDCDFTYGGTLVSNGDIGFNGRKEKDRANATGTTHGGVERINGQWYVFYHRLTHGSDYSRQACAEKLEMLPDGRFAHAEITSCGLNTGDLTGFGEYPAAICCHLTHGHMPHVANQKRTGIPMVTHQDSQQYIGGASSGTEIVYRYFDLSRTKAIAVTARGIGSMELFADRHFFGRLDFSGEGWQEQILSVSGLGAHQTLRIKIARGELDILRFVLQ